MSRTAANNLAAWLDGLRETGQHTAIVNDDQWRIIERAATDNGMTRLHSDLEQPVKLPNGNYKLHGVEVRR